MQIRGTASKVISALVQRVDERGAAVPLLRHQTIKLSQHSPALLDSRLSRHFLYYKVVPQ